MNMAAQLNQLKDCAFLLLAESCNLRCSHCYVEAGPAVGKYMALDVVKSAFDVLAELGINDIRLTGGEPSIHPDFYRILDIAKNRQIRLGLVSNGVKILNAARIEEIFATLSRCWISLYGTSSKSHGKVSRRLQRDRSNLESMLPIGCRWVRSIDLQARKLQYEHSRISVRFPAVEQKTERGFGK